MSGGISARRMTAGDLEAVIRIEQKSFPDPWSFQSFQESLGQSQAIWMVIEKADGKEKWPIGYAGVYTVLDEGEIVNVAMEPEERGKGYGKILVEKLMEEGAKRGVSDFYLEVRMGNEAGKRLYRSLGFEPCGVRKDFYEQPREDALVMRCTGFPVITTGGQSVR